MDERGGGREGFGGIDGVEGVRRGDGGGRGRGVSGRSLEGDGGVGEGAEGAEGLEVGMLVWRGVEELGGLTGVKVRGALRRQVERSVRETIAAGILVVE